MRKILYILIISVGFSFDINVDYGTFLINDEIYETPFIGGLNKPKVQWIDWNYDGKDDMFILDEDGCIKYYQNQGCPNSNCSFKLITTRFQNIDDISWFYIGNFDLDDDYEMISQNPYQLTSMIYYENENDVLIVSGDVLDINGNLMDNNPVMTPTFVDIDDDGDLDFFIGKTIGTVTFYENISYSNNLPTFEFITDFWQDIYIVGSSSNQRHGASAITFIDLDQDDDYDLTWGDYFQQSLYIIWNIGDISNAHMDHENILNQYPIDNPVITAGLNMPSFSDVDNDGDKDLFVSVLSGAYGYQLRDNFIFYENDGGFVYKTSNFLKGVDFLSDINPEFADIDNDGDLDLFIGTDFDPSSFPWVGRILFFKNIGYDNNQEPIWSLENDDILNNDSDNNLSPEFVDIDFDGDLDLFVGDFNGRVKFYENIAPSNNYIEENDLFEFAFVENISNIDLSGYSTPEMLDIDNDEDYDLFIGHMNGTIYFYENIGNKYIYDFQLVDQNFQNISVPNRSNPKFYDFDMDMDMDLFVGTAINNIIIFENDSQVFYEYLNNSYDIPFLGNNTSPDFYDSNQINAMIAGISTGGMYFITIDNYILGDVNNDAIINIFDVVLLIEYILFDSSIVIPSIYLDINNDGSINVIDVIELINIILEN